MFRSTVAKAVLVLLLSAVSGLAQSFNPCPSPQTGDLCATSGSKVGIGTNTPEFQLTIGNGTDIRVFGVDNRAIFLAKNSGGIYEQYLWPRWSDDLMYLNYGSAGFRIRNNDSSVTTMFMDNAGKVGIGAAAADRLTVFGGTSNINIGGNFGSGYNAIWLNGGTGNADYNFLSSATDQTLYVNSTAGLQFRISNATKMILNSLGNLGVGTILPVGKLDIRAATVLPGSGWGTAQLLSADILGADKGGVLNFGGSYTTQGAVTSWASIAGLKANANDQETGGYLAFYTRPSDNVPLERMRIDQNGVVSIGSPSGTGNKLTVNGDATFNGTVGGTNIKAHYQDVAEWVPAVGAMSAGTTVILDPTHNNRVMPSETAYDTRVAGVVSQQPGVILGIADPSKAMIATTGRVKVRVDASRLPIRIGDLLVTSGQAGMAMRSEPIDVAGVKIHRPGTLVGKALEPLASGQGEILVLLSLQ